MLHLHFEQYDFIQQVLYDICLQHGEGSLGPPIIVCTRPYPECQLYSDEEAMGGRDVQEADMDSAGDSGAGSESSDGGRHVFLRGNKSAAWMFMFCVVAVLTLFELKNQNTSCQNFC